MNQHKNLKIAIIGPEFFGYCRSIAGIVQSRGIPCQYYDELFSNNMFLKALIRLGFGSIFNPIKKRYYNTLKARILNEGVTHVLLISVEFADDVFVSELNLSGVRSYLYLWDGLDRKPNCKKIISLVEKVGTFDPYDACRLKGKHIHLFAEDVFKAHENSSLVRANSIAFAGTLHSDRPRVIMNLLKYLENKDIKFTPLIYYRSKLFFRIKASLQPQILPLINLLSEKPFEKKQISELFQASRYVLDIAFPSQRGLTSRTFEALISGAILITRSSTATLPSSFKDRIILYKDLNNEIDSIIINKISPRNLNESEMYFLSIHRFVDEILELMGVE